MSENEKNLVFVYGTLRKESSNHFRLRMQTFDTVKDASDERMSTRSLATIETYSDTKGFRVTIGSRLKRQNGLTGI